MRVERLHEPLRSKEFPLGMKEVAALLGVQPNTVYRWKQRGKLPPPDGHISGVDGWWRETLEEWRLTRKRPLPRGRVETLVGVR